MSAAKIVSHTRRRVPYYLPQTAADCKVKACVFDDSRIEKCMRIVVTGGRAFDDAKSVARALSAVHSKHGMTALIHGGARGADSLCAAWAQSAGIPVHIFAAEWDKFGKGAGHIRNQRMIDEGRPDAAVAFPGGRGTADMVRRCELAGLPTWRIARIMPA